MTCVIVAKQVSLAFRGGYVPDEFHTPNTKTLILGLNKAKNSSFPSLFMLFESVNSQNLE